MQQHYIALSDLSQSLALLPLVLPATGESLQPLRALAPLD
jgi:hypothetical protein